MSDDLTPSQIRARILAEHEDLRGRLATLDALAAADDTDGIRGLLTALLPFLADHMALEEATLVPALMEADAFGDVRSDTLHAHHDRMNGLADEMQKMLADPSSGLALVGLAAEVTAHLRHEMEDEEKALLRPDILRDDFITTGLGG